jgi:tRNA (guanosine-2'-O-)-methyltransferase
MITLNTMKTHANLTRGERIKKIMDQRRIDLCLVLENLSEYTNISAILRTAESFGVGQIYIIHPKGEKPRISRQASSGAAKWLNIEYFTSTKTCLNKLKKNGFKIFGALVDPASDILWQEKFSGKVAIMVGNEADGLSKGAQELVDKNIYLPMFGLTESLNVSVSAGIFLYEVIRQKEA